ncbi:CpsD/CapB family tyrosine-protein kinase [Anseongella ginsenosidimutans]|nr:CpsD/CapB family tyrosine-protein kinase [Anseongella ginsenosidimutans]
MGLIVPLTYVNSKDFLHSRIKSEFDIEKYTDISIIGKIGRNTGSSNLVIHEASNSLIAESFRSLRTNLQFVLNFNASNVIMVTSSTHGEGKTFLTWNLGSSLALAGKKVVFIELDLRKPKLSGMMGIEYDHHGYTDYINEDLDVQSIIKPSLFNENCFIVSSGPVPLNPSELLLSEKLGKLIAYLRSRFDYVIIDSPPVGLVSDALIIEKFADITMYVARHNYTNKSQIEIVNELKRKTKIRNLYLVVNDINLARAGYIGYGNSYV